MRGYEVHRTGGDGVMAGPYINREQAERIMQEQLSYISGLKDGDLSIRWVELGVGDTVFDLESRSLLRIVEERG